MRSVGKDKMIKQKAWFEMTPGLPKRKRFEQLDNANNRSNDDLSIQDEFWDKTRKASRDREASKEFIR
jgi:hypothetical protein